MTITRAATSQQIRKAGGLKKRTTGLKRPRGVSRNRAGRTKRRKWWHYEIEKSIFGLNQGIN